MALVIDLRITAGAELAPLDRLVIRRLTALHAPMDKAADEVHQYEAKVGEPVRATTTFAHRYGDGAWVCVLKALEALR